MSSKRKEPVDLGQFQPAVEEALKAFGSDVSYGVAMARSAVAIQRKREVWAIRLEVRRAEEMAKEKCDRRRFVCKSPNPCGSGSCAFASDELASVDVVTGGTTPRPRNSKMPEYSIEGVVHALKDMRGEGTNDEGANTSA